MPWNWPWNTTKNTWEAKDLRCSLTTSPWKH
jgi:hypothetical protein